MILSETSNMELYSELINQNRYHGRDLCNYETIETKQSLRYQLR